MNVGFFGAGKMAEGILSAMGDVSSIIMAEKNKDRADEIASKYGVRTTANLKDVIDAADLIFLAVRPQDVNAVADEVRPMLRNGQALVSIVAGKTLLKLREAFGPHVALVRVMPNLALRAGAGMCAVCAENDTPPEWITAVQNILGKAGETAVLKESAFDAVTALSGSGPAYFAYMEQAMLEGGVALGLSPEIARLLAEQTMYGTAKFLRENKMDLQQFIAGVCTKGGTTAAGMEHLSNPQFKKIVADTLAAAAQRSKELA